MGNGGLPQAGATARRLMPSFRRLCVLGILTMAAFFPQKTIAADGPVLNNRFDNPVWSPDGKHVALSGNDHRGVYLLDTQTNVCLQISDAPSSGYAFNWSADGKRLGFKQLIAQPAGQFPLQQPSVFEVANKKLTALCEPVALAGIPSFSDDGKLAYTVDRELRVISPAGQIVTYRLDHYVSITPISPDGEKIAYNGADDAMRVLDLATGKASSITPPGIGWIGPVWSPDSTRLVVGTIDGRLHSVELATLRTWELDEGIRPSWMPDSQTICYARAERQFGVRLLDSDLFSIRYDGEEKTRLTTQAGGLETSGRVSPDGSRVAYLDISDGQVRLAGLARKAGQSGEGIMTAGADSAAGTYQLEAPQPLIGAGAQIQTLADKPWGDGGATTETAQGPTMESSVILAGEVRLSRPVPYVHQVYDTDPYFNGHWACGATSAIMAIQYYEILPTWKITVLKPYPHDSLFGKYVSAIYSFNGVTYNIGSPDPVGNLGYGGYGYIVRNNWADTRSYMRDYFINHGLGSAVDWYPSWDKLKAEVHADHPMVLLNNLTTAGHYITTIGYVDDGHRTAIFNDPYGNKNTPGYPSYDGAGARYDWPDYPNGYQSLNPVVCFIYARGGQAPTITQNPVDRFTARGATARFSVACQGLGPISYRWQKNLVNLTDNGHYSGVTTNTLTISNVVDADAASYRCVVNNTYGSVNSTAALLKINLPDFSGDRDVDNEDFGHLQRCLDESGKAPSANCANADLDGDGDVDAFDLLRFTPCLAGPGQTPPAGCL